MLHSTVDKPVMAIYYHFISHITGLRPHFSRFGAMQMDIQEFEKTLTERNKAFIDQFPNTPLLLSASIARLQELKPEKFISVLKKIQSIPKENFKRDYSKAYFEHENEKYFISIVHFTDENYTEAFYEEFNNDNVKKVLLIGFEDDD